MLQIISFVSLIVLNAVILNQVLVHHAIIKKPNYVSIFIFSLLALPIIHIEDYWIIIIANFLLVFILNELFALSNSMEPKKKILNSGLLVGLMSIINFYFSIYYLLIKSCLVYYKKINIKNWIILNIGFSVPFVIFYSISYFTNLDYIILNTDLINTNNPLNYKISYSLMILIVIVALIELGFNFHKKKIKSKQAFILLAIITLLIISQIIIWGFMAFAYLSIIPISICVNNYLIYTIHTRFRTFLVGLWVVIFLFEFFYL